MKRRFLTCFGILLGFVLLLVVVAAALVGLYDYRIHAPAAGQINGEIVSSGITRTYVLHVPASYDPARPAPLVISLHGFAGWPAQQMETSRWNDLADREGFLVVYPAGTSFPLHWVASGTDGAGGDPLQDVEFISALLDKLESEYTIDPARVYANGHSNGGGMSYMLACTLADRIAAIGAVSGAFLYPPADCHPSRPVPFIGFHGTADPIVPYTGGPSGSFHYDFPVIPDFFQAWAARNGCSPAPEALPVSGDVTGVHYGDCAQNADVVFYTIHGGGHSWPGGGRLPEFIVGSTTYDIDATSVMWSFFAGHPLE